MISPIKVGDEFYGIVGIDLELDYLQNKLRVVESNCQEHHNHAEHNCHQDAHVLVLSQNKTIAATTSRPSFIGMKITDINYDRLFDDQQIKKTDKHINDNYLDVETPIILGQTRTAWSVKVIIPMADILAKGHELKHAAEKELYQMVVINIIGVMFFMFIVWYSAGNLSRPIKMGADALESIAEGKGDLTQRLPVHSKDEAGQMSLMFNRFMDNLQELVLGIVNGLNTLSEAVNNISSSIERQVTILSQQSASVTEITGTMSELTTSSTQIADHAGRVADLSETTLVHTKKGRDIVQEMQDRINNIYDENNRNVQEILALGKKSKEVNKVIEIINNITDQTKLIAFNAALEASSAGDSGKRFGVVAVEIRRLADSVIDSTRETESIINEIDESVNRMIIESENRGKSISKGLESASNTSETFMQIVSSAQTTTDASHQISLSTQQQKTASEQVISALREIDEGVKQSTQSMKAIRSICNELQNLSNKLRGLVSQFNVLDK
ncbi:MAG: Frizzy aggregation protein frzCD [Candidatus Magnetoglobus multicellularis str. Araruama]|uniref:Frizzy aggregation protein frzCD n=1 Tax=Candidatus Magnetoglobus multicellularis str. Araruama TaxID=890399 RepID=A0A1V1P2M3_9BACT|nr:MAG: Frizzy aggregation protein frzCD [Candidatus Magnetoglobus multicellularis str. Araruama]